MTDLSLADIERLTKTYADRHEELTKLVGELNGALDLVKREYLSSLKQTVGRTAERYDALRAAIEGAPGLFERPRSYIFHGVRVGWQKLKGSIVVPDPERTVELIERHLAPLAATLIRVIREPDKRAIADLSVSDARKIGCEIIDARDVVLIKPANSDVDKIVSALLKEATGELAVG
jgi:hypothetical protein